MATETELQATIKRMESQLQGQAQQFRQLEGGYFSVGATFRAAVQDLLLALASGDPDDMTQAKKNAKELVKHWDAGIEMKKAQEQKAGQIIQPPAVKLVGPNGESS